MRSTRTTLTAPRSLVRLTSSTQVPDDNVLPFLTSADIEMLHHRLITSESEGAREKIGYIKWVCKAYERALRGRREETLKARAEKAGQGIVDSDTEDFSTGTQYSGAGNHKNQGAVTRYAYTLEVL